MKQILDEYGEVVIGMIAAVLITILAVVLFKDGGILEGFISSVANNAILPGTNQTDREKFRQVDY